MRMTNTRRRETKERDTDTSSRGYKWRLCKPPHHSGTPRFSPRLLSQRDMAESRTRLPVLAHGHKPPRLLSLLVVGTLLAGWFVMLSQMPSPAPKLSAELTVGTRRSLTGCDVLILNLSIASEPPVYARRRSPSADHLSKEDRRGGGEYRGDWGDCGDVG